LVDYGKQKREPRFIKRAFCWRWRWNKIEKALKQYLSTLTVPGA
jgi:hypothetical protein